MIRGKRIIRFSLQPIAPIYDKAYIGATYLKLITAILSVTAGFDSYFSLAFHSLINSVIVSFTDMIRLARQALLPAKA